MYRLADARRSTRIIHDVRMGIVSHDHRRDHVTGVFTSRSDAQTFEVLFAKRGVKAIRVDNLNTMLRERRSILDNTETSLIAVFVDCDGIEAVTQFTKIILR